MRLTQAVPLILVVLPLVSGYTADPVSLCQHGGADLIPHSTRCQSYYNCSSPEPIGIWDTRSAAWDKYEQECPYPQLFDVTTKRCKGFEGVNCGPDRVPGKDPCSYKQNLCSGRCPPCEVTHVSCLGLANGYQPDPVRLWSDVYVRCQSERTVEKLQCPQATPETIGDVAYLEKRMRFSPVARKCVSLLEVPQEYGGFAPSCQGKAPGLYRTILAPMVYFRCPGAEVLYCPNGSDFQLIENRCKSRGFDIAEYFKNRN